MTKEQVKAILDRVLSWPPGDQERVARFAAAIEQSRDHDDITEEEWKVIEARAARRELATEDEVERLFATRRASTPVGG